MKKQLSKLDLRPEDLPVNNLNAEQLEKIKGGQSSVSDNCVCECVCYQEGDTQGQQLNYWSMSWQ